MDKSAGAEKNGVIIVRLLGGLGNQLFQYALGRQLSVIHSRPLKLDTSYYTESTPDAKKGIRIYCLSHFNIQAKIASGSELKEFKKYQKKNLLSKALRYSQSQGKYYSHKYIFEPSKNYFVFDQNLLGARLKPVAYLDGFWQTEKYFQNIESEIRKELSFKEQASEENQKMLAGIKVGNSVALHIRHGDNATKIAATHGVTPMEYYEKAASGLSSKIPEPHFYIFSDDIAWTKENLRLKFPCTFVSHNSDEKNYEDLRLMSNCKHHIIGNSTFSWWGAWLGQKDGQLVYAPKRYHMNSNLTPKDLYPANWQLINV